MAESVLYYGDNLDVLRLHVKGETVDLVYLDPPFNSNQDYNVLFEEHSGERSASQIRAFEDTWHWDLGAEAAYRGMVEAGGRVSDAMRAMRTFLGESDMMAYLAMMAPRLVELRRVLKSTGSIYLHCDPTASHYLKILMDSIFGPQNFRNEIIWYYYNKMHDSRKKLFPRATDTLLFYVKDVSRPFAFRQLKELRDVPTKQLARKKVDGRMVNVKDEEGHVVYRVKEDRTIDNVWRIPCLQPASKERLDYPTQKPRALLRRVIEASSNENDLVLDPFCGCGTTIAVCQEMKRKWIGIDITHLAVNLIKHRLLNSFGAEQGRDYDVVGEPTDLSGARTLAVDDPYQFQWWALGRVGARPAEQKKGADKGIDGRLLFHDEADGGKTKQIVLSVKAGRLAATHPRDLRGVLEREGAEIGVLLTMEEPTKLMRTEAASAGFYQSPWGTKHPRLQILTVGDLLEGKRIDYPPSRQVNVTFKKAPEPKVAETPSESLFEDEPQEGAGKRRRKRK